MRPVDKSKNEFDDLAAGDFYIETDAEGQLTFYFCLPNGIGCHIPIRPLIDPTINGGHSWEWDGNAHKPTLTPSVNAGIWHGWVRAGRLVSC